MAEFIKESRSMEERYTEAMQMAGYDPVEPQEGSLATVFFQSRATKEISGWDGWESVGWFLERHGMEQEIRSLDFWTLVNQGHFTQFEEEDFTYYKKISTFQMDIMMQLVPPEALQLEKFLFQDMVFNGREFSESSFINCRFCNCHFQDSLFQNTDFSGSLFSACDWSGVRMESCRFSQNQFSACVFSDGIIRQSDFSDVGFLDTRITGSVLEENRIKNAVSQETKGPYRILTDLQALQKTEEQKQAENKKKTVCMGKSR